MISQNCYILLLSFFNEMKFSSPKNFERKIAAFFCRFCVTAFLLGGYLFLKQTAQ
jgi:hypothetical protein